MVSGTPGAKFTDYDQTSTVLLYLPGLRHGSFAPSHIGTWFLFSIVETAKPEGVGSY